ncbi:2-keto-4-pentenoate hydratase/2-oxohepta-3-ene-1,7-dioic acid hydratase in catechol pathway [Caballeronia udeis]|uniref:2-keto-4-pentenoate hydratase/2-oxohepta-3-ene-1,7-dioic acid hydratase in catechol pathway n=1 Tax=Caballeronia udeis TaxID=1232866 RepID=A0ABW8MXK1_9BURK
MAIGARTGGGFIDLTAAGLPTTLDAMLASGSDAIDRAESIVKQARRVEPVLGLRILTPLQKPSKAIAVGLNYVDHAAEIKATTLDYPVLFHRYPSSWVAHDEALQLPKVSSHFDYEGELVVVIGKGGVTSRKSMRSITCSAIQFSTTERYAIIRSSRHSG